MSINSSPQRLLRKYFGIIASAPGKILNLTGVALDSLPLPAVIVDRRGKIISINKCWMDPVWGTGILGGFSIELGGNYLEACGRAAAAGLRNADIALRGIRGVCDGSIPAYEFDYPAPDGERWFSMTVTPLLRWKGGAVITHRDISDLKRTQASLRESEEILKNIRGRLINAQDQERSGITRRAP